MKKIFTISLLLSFVFLMVPCLVAQSGVGKLAGKIVDVSTKEPLIGANVLILNTQLGAATNVDGEYFILNINPGTYTIKFSYVGYGGKEIQDIRIVPGITYELDVELVPGIELVEVVVTDKKLFEENATNTVKVVDSDQISKLPVRGVENLASLQAGVVRAEGSGGVGGNAEINVRGGRTQEVLYVVDGIVQNSALWNQNFSQVSNAAIEQISFQVGGFEAKYGQAQSGIINVTTKSGYPKYTLYGDMLTSSFTDDFGYNLYNANIGGPIIPGSTDHTFFLSAERGWFLDGTPSAIGANFPSIGYSSPVLPNNSEHLWRLSARTYHNLGSQFILRLGGNYNVRDYRIVLWNVISPYNLLEQNFAKNNSDHFPKRERDNLSATARLTQNIGESSFWDLTLGFRRYYQLEGDGVFFDNVNAYGDTLFNPYLPSQADDSRLLTDDIGLWTDYGRVSDYYRKIDDMGFTADISFSSQLENHLIEAGGGGTYGSISYYRLTPVGLGLGVREYTNINGQVVPAVSPLDRYIREQPYYYGYDVMGGQNKDDAYDYVEPYKPIMAYGYIQDRFELEDLVLNIGLRFDYVDTKSHQLKDPALPYAGGSEPDDLDWDDFKIADPETYFSPRIGIGFPVTETTVFHAQYGKFIQQPRLIDVYPFFNRVDNLKQTDAFTTNNGYLSSEKTTQYEVGFRQILGENAASINITAFYKNTQGLTNTQVVKYQRIPGGEFLDYYPPANSDFGTVKGLALTLDIPRISYFALSVNYTFSIAEGTGSATDAAYVAAFRNNNGETPKTIAPLDFDQPHTGIINFDFTIPKGEMGLLEMTGLNVLFSFNSGRPYTPLETQSLLDDNSNWGSTKGFVNSTYGPGSFKIDLKLEKSFEILDNTLITPYLWIENLLDADNAILVWRSTGSPETTNFLNTETGKKLAAQNGTEWVQDYESLENDPYNYGIPRLIKLGLKINFAGI
jgi:hypothetical protein